MGCASNGGDVRGTSFLAWRWFLFIRFGPNTNRTSCIPNPQSCPELSILNTIYPWYSKVKSFRGCLSLLHFLSIIQISEGKSLRSPLLAHVRSDTNIKWWSSSTLRAMGCQFPLSIFWCYWLLLDYGHPKPSIAAVSLLPMISSSRTTGVTPSLFSWRICVVVSWLSVFSYPKRPLSNYCGEAKALEWLISYTVLFSMIFSDLDEWSTGRHTSKFNDSEASEKEIFVE